MFSATSLTWKLSRKRTEQLWGFLSCVCVWGALQKRRDSHPTARMCWRIHLGRTGNKLHHHQPSNVLGRQLQPSWPAPSSREPRRAGAATVCQDQTPTMECEGRRRFPKVALSDQEPPFGSGDPVASPIS